MVGRSDWDVVVFFKVDVSVLFVWVISSVEEFMFDVWVGVVNDVLVIVLVIFIVVDRIVVVVYVIVDIGVFIVVGVVVEVILMVVLRLLLRGRGRFVRSSVVRSGIKVGVGMSIEVVVVG